MIRQCSWCNRVLGEKEPFEDKSVTHTICEKCQEDMVGSVKSQRKTLFTERQEEK